MRTPRAIDKIAVLTEALTALETIATEYYAAKETSTARREWHAAFDYLNACYPNRFSRAIERVFKIPTSQQP